MVLFVDNALFTPFTYEVNLFLKETTFPNGYKVNFKMDGFYKGTKLMTADPSGKLDKNQNFNRNSLKFKECERSSFSS